jgi:gliding motility-associated-like protein
MNCTFNATGGSPGSTFSWAFGDLTPIATGNSVTHAYQFSNIFTPVAIVTDAVSGCTAVANNTSGPTIPVSNLPVLNVSSSNGYIGCNPPFSTNISGQGSSSGSPLGGGLTYSWQFNTGTPGGSTSNSPGNVTFQQGNHSIILTATDNNFCTASTTLGVSVVNPTASAVVAPTVCLNVFAPITITSPQSLFSISATGAAGGSSTSTLVPNVATTFAQALLFTVPGPQVITITVPSAGNCPAFVMTKSVFVEQVVPNFTPVPPLINCQTPMVVQYANTSSVNTSANLTFTWFPSWGNVAMWNAIPNQIVTTNTTTNATFTLSQGSNNPYTIFDMFTPNITLFVKSSNGCFATIVQSYHTLVRPNARFNKKERMGCAPLVVMLRDTSYVSSSFPITSWTWNSGTTPPIIVTNTQITTFTYTSPGMYVPTLTIQTAGGCSSSWGDTVYVTNPPTVNATFPSTVCAGVPVTINMTGGSSTTPPGTVNHWHITTDLGYFSSCITDPNPTFPFTHTGTHTVIASASEFNCSTSNTLAALIQVFGPLGKFVFTTHCSGDKKLVDFDVHLQDVSTATLSFGDNSPPVIITGLLGGSFSGQYSHQYPASGDYNATLRSERVPGNCAPRIVSQAVHIRQPVARITWGTQQIPALPQALSCTKKKLAFSGLSSSENTISCSTGYKWWFSGPNYELPVMDCSHGLFATHGHASGLVICDVFQLDTFRTVGIYTISLEVKDINGCADTTTKIFRIGNAVPVFTFASNPMCMSSGSAQIINTTQSSLVPPDAITSYTWQYGDGGVDISTNPYFNPSHLYTLVTPPSQTFQVMAIAMSSLNCIDTTKHILQVNNPATGFYTGNTYPCIKAGQNSNPVNFTAFQGYSTYSLNVGTPTLNPPWQSTSTFTNVTKTYPLPGVYFPTLTVVDNASCSATTVLTITAIGQPTTNIRNLGASGFCVPAKIKLRDSVAINVTPVSGYQWNIANITSPVSPTDTLLENIFTTSGTFTVKLTVYAGPANFCPSTASVLVHVFDTRAKLEIDRLVFCLGDVVTVKAKDLKDVYSWKWFFGDLVSQPIIYNTVFATNPLAYKYDTYPPNSTSGKTIITLKAVSDNLEGCVKLDTVSVQVIKIDPDFIETKNNYLHCLTSAPDTFVNKTLNPLNLNYNLSWKFPASTSISGSLTPHQFSTAGIFPVTLTVQDDKYSCTADAVKNMTILPLPKSEISISDTLVCPGDTFVVSMKGYPVFPGYLTGYFTPSTNSVIALPPSNTYSIALTTTVSKLFSFSVLDTNRCVSPAHTVEIQVPAPAPEIHTATTVVIGQTLTLNAEVPGNFSYYWSPEKHFLTDSIGPQTVSSSTQSITYSVVIVDQPEKCWAVINTYSVIVLPLTTIDVPTAFTPNGDGINDFIFPDGWGIRKLLFFRVYNRWGQLLFETNELKKGWDGYYLGVLQNMETYVYQAEVETYIESEPKLSKSGTFKLIR